MIEFAPQDIQRLCRLTHHIDHVTSEIDSTSSCNHARRLRLKQVRLRIYEKIRNLVNEAHWKTADYLCSRFDVILLPDFQTQQMVKKVDKHNRHRKINRDTARRLLIWSHYTFKQRLLNKAREWGKTLVIVNEAYTSKTCTSCGWQHPTLGGRKVYLCQSCGLRLDRDANGARNICLRNICA